MNRQRWIAVGVLALVVVLYVVVLGMGIGNGRSGGQPVKLGPMDFLGNLLVRPATLQDVTSATSTCLASDPLVVQRGTACVYNLKAGFLGKKLRLTLTAGAASAEVLQQASDQPRVDDTKQLALNSPAEFTYKQDGSTLRIACGPLAPCRVSLSS